jgi:hypothetical protein
MSSYCRPTEPGTIGAEALIVTEVSYTGSKPEKRLNRRTGSKSNTDSGGDTMKVEATLWINGDGFPQATLHLPSGDVILQIPSKDAHGKVRASKPYRAVLEALEAEGVTDR